MLLLFFVRCVVVSVYFSSNLHRLRYVVRSIVNSRLICTKKHMVSFNAWEKSNNSLLLTWVDMVGCVRMWMRSPHVPLKMKFNMSKRVANAYQWKWKLCSLFNIIAVHAIPQIIGWYCMCCVCTFSFNVELMAMIASMNALCNTPIKYYSIRTSESKRIEMIAKVCAYQFAQYIAKYCGFALCFKCFKFP